MSEKTIKIADEFSKTPYGRYPDDGDNNGQSFREEHLVPALKEYDKVIVDLDGVRGYGSSFLDEAFGGLIRKKYFTSKELWQKLELKTNFDSYIEEIESYVNEAIPED